MKVEAVVMRRIQDLVCDAAQQLLREEVATCESVERADLWSFEFESDQGHEQVRTVLDETTLVVNPNIHHYTLDSWDEPPEDGCRLFVRVEERTDAKARSVRRSIRARLGFNAVNAVHRAVLWTIDLDLDDPEEAERIGREIGGLAGHGAGVLANSHSQDVQIRVVSA